VIIGFPYDEGAKKNGARCGSDYGPGRIIIILKNFRLFQKVCEGNRSDRELRI
jgi:hypothetical protein